LSLWREVWPKAIPSGPGVYVVYENDRIVYVGSTTELKKRVRVYFTFHHAILGDYGGDNHIDRTYGTPWGFKHDGDGIRVKVKQSRRCGDWLMWEWRLICRLRPRENRAGVK
jgi:hypothetical protein